MDEGSTTIPSLTQEMNDSSFKILNKTPNLTGFLSWRCQKPKGQPGAMLSEPSTKQSGEQHLKYHLYFPTYIPLSEDSLSFQTASFYPVHIIQIRRLGSSCACYVALLHVLPSPRLKYVSPAPVVLSCCFYSASKR